MRLQAWSWEDLGYHGVCRSFLKDSYMALNRRRAS